VIQYKSATQVKHHLKTIAGLIIKIHNGIGTIGFMWLNRYAYGGVIAQANIPVA
jgi:hypothetical protein